MAWDKKIPFDLSNTHQIARVYSWTNASNLLWVDNYVFPATMGIASISADGVDLSDGKRTYWMFMSDFRSILKGKTLTKGVFTGKFTFRKQGQSYGVYCVE